MPAYLSTETFASATTVVLIAALLSALIVIHRVRHLDLVEVLKTREARRAEFVGCGGRSEPHRLRHDCQKAARSMRIAALSASYSG